MSGEEDLPYYLFQQLVLCLQSSVSCSVVFYISFILQLMQLECEICSRPGIYLQFNIHVCLCTQPTALQADKKSLCFYEKMCNIVKFAFLEQENCNYRRNKWRFWWTSLNFMIYLFLFFLNHFSFMTKLRGKSDNVAGWESKDSPAPLTVTMAIY